METFIAMTIFRDEFNVAFLVMFAAVTFIKIFHWLAQDRVDYVEITPHVSRFQHFRIVSFMLLLMVELALSHQTAIITMEICMCRLLMSTFCSTLCIESLPAMGIL